MSFNTPAAFNAQVDAQLLAATQPPTLVKSDQPSTMSGNASGTDHGNDAVRFLNASGPLLTPALPAFHQHPMDEAAAFRAMAQGAALQFPAIYPGMHPAVSLFLVFVVSGLHTQFEYLL